MVACQLRDEYTYILGLTSTETVSSS